MNPNTENALNAITRTIRLCLFVCLGFLVPRDAAADAVTDWNVSVGRASVAACLAPFGNGPAEARMYAMVHVAIHDALNAIDRRSRPYAFDAEVNAAGLTRCRGRGSRAGRARVGHRTAPGIAGVCRRRHRQRRSRLCGGACGNPAPGPKEPSGVEVGQAAAAAIIALRASDGSDAPLLDFDYPQGTEPGEYRFRPGCRFRLRARLGRTSRRSSSSAARSSVPVRRIASTAASTRQTSTR